MKQYLFVGDTHGDMDFLQRAFERAREEEITDVIQVGDFGFLFPKWDNLEYVSRLCAMYGVTLRFIDGNHDWHPELRRRQDMHSTACTTLPGGGVPLGAPEYRENVIYQPRGSTYVDIHGTRFLFCGGAPSIDWWNRIEGVSIWTAEEVISEEEFERTLYKHYGKVDVLVTHDAPEFPPGFGPKGDLQFQAKGARSMEMINTFLQEHAPDLHVHGHWHKRYTSKYWGARVEGLDCNLAHFIDDALLIWSRA